MSVVHPAHSPTPARAPAEASTSRGLWATVERTPFGLERHTPAWEDLVAHAAEPNPFYEPFALLAAWRHLPPAEGLRVVLVWAPNPLPGQPPILTGLFPLVQRDRYKGLPVSVLATWKHLYAYLGTPLVRADLANETLDTLFDWLRLEATASVFEWTSIGADGPFRHALTDTLNRRGFDAFHDSRHTRAIFRPGASAEAYLEAAVPGKKRKELRRQERRLGELGAVTYDELPPDGDLEAWLDEFLALEERGWKGQGGTALRGDPAALEVFRSCARGAFARGRWMMLALRVGGQAIAVKCNLLAGPGAIALKIAYDESFARFSPGVLLEIENIRRLHERRPAVWMDSGASADHPMIGHLWRDRLAIETLVVPTGRPPGVLAIAAMPLVRWTSRAVRGALHRLRRKT